jgi:hypothetical protein
MGPRPIAARGRADLLRTRHAPLVGDATSSVSLDALTPTASASQTSALRFSPKDVVGSPMSKSRVACPERPLTTLATPDVYGTHTVPRAVARDRTSLPRATEFAMRLRRRERRGPESLTAPQWPRRKIPRVRREISPGYFLVGSKYPEKENFR